jgi:hypothetical protein
VAAPIQLGEDGRVWLDRHMKRVNAIQSSSPAKGAARPGDEPGIPEVSGATEHLSWRAPVRS